MAMDARMNFQTSEIKPDYAHTIPYNPSLDGIRAIAILGVLLAHFGIPSFKGGGQGVDIFFVLSGYLITISILREKNFQIGIFYWRRATRLLPASIIICILYLIFGWFSLDHSQLISDIGTTLTFVSNWTRAFSSGSPQYLGQTWSLSVEEQFYLLAPVMLLLAHRFDGRVTTFMLASATAVCIVYRTVIFHQGTSFDRVYNGLDTHCDGLLCGVMLGKVEVDGLFRRFRMQIATGGLFALGIIFLMFSATEWDVTISGIIDLAALCLIIAVTENPKSLLSKMLALSPIVKLGQISYSLYLWHYPIFLFLFYHLRVSHAVQIWIGIPLSLIMATLSHRFVEQPALRLRNWPKSSNQRRFGILNVSLTIALIVIGTAVYLKDEIIDVVAPPPLRIEAYGPQSSIKGVGFNVQPNGTSIIWAKTSTKIPDKTKALWHGHVIEMSKSLRNFYIVVPSDLLYSVGDNLITLEAGGVLIASLNIRIIE